MVTMQQEQVGKCWDELQPMLEAHWEEVAAFKDDIKLNVDRDAYENREKFGSFVLFTVRDSGKLVGYNAFFLSFHPHYKDHIYAVNDVLFIDPAYRHNGLAVEFVQFCEHELKYVHLADVVTYHMKVYKPFESLMKFCGYGHLEHLYGRKL